MRPRFRVSLIALLLIASCSVGRKSPYPVVQADAKQLTGALIPLDTSGSHGVTVTFDYPEFRDPTPVPLADSLRTFVVRSLFAPLEGEGDTLGVEQMAAQLAAQYLELREDFPGYDIPWEVTRKGRVEFDSVGLVTIRLDEYSFLGGAHGLETSRLATFDAESGRRLVPSDLFKPGSEEALGRLIEEEFRRERGIAAGASLTGAGFWVEEGKFPVAEVWGVVRGGILYYYPPYEIGPYAVGPTEVVVPTDRLRGILRPDGALEL